MGSDPAEPLTKQRGEGGKRVDDSTRPLLSRPIADLGPFTQLYFASRVSYDITLIFNKTMLWTRKGTHHMPSSMNNQRPWDPGGSMPLPLSPPTTLERKVSNA